MKRYDTDTLNHMEQALNTAVLCDVLDDMGYRSQAMNGYIYPLEAHYKLFGVARTILAYDVYELPNSPYATEIEAVDSIKEGDVMVCVNPSRSNGFWGELMTTAAIARGARGVVMDGAIRDIRQIVALGDCFRAFTAGRSPLDSKGRCLVAAYNCPVECDGVIVYPGDLIFTDIDGIVVVPRAVVDEACARALEKVQGENVVREELRKGAYLKDVYAKYHIL